MQVLYFIPRYDRLAMGNRIHAEIIIEWRRRGVTAEVLTLSAGIAEIISGDEDGIRVHRLPVSGARALKLANRALDVVLPYPYLAGAIAQYRHFLQGRRYDLVHVETAFPLGLVTALVSAHESPPIAVTLPGADIMAEPEYDYGYGRFPAVRMLLPQIFRRASVLRADSPQIRELAVRRGADPQRVVAIPYNITADSFPPDGCDLQALRAESRDAVLARHRLDPQRPLVISLNRLHPFKGIAYLIDALPYVQARGVRPHVLIVGPNRVTPRFGDYGAYLQRRASDLGVAADVHLIGAVPHQQTLQYLAAADVAVVPSVAESFSRVVVEAAAVGTPAVVTDTTGVSAYVADHQAGVVVEPRCGASIAAGLHQLLTDPTRWHEVSRRAVAMAPAFSSSQIADALLALYGRITPIPA
jgi:glycosyltransferase involved in cell wall biosynthesis